MNVFQRRPDQQRDLSGISQVSTVADGQYGLLSLASHGWPNKRPWRVRTGLTGALAIADVLALALCFGAATAVSPAVESTLPTFAATGACVLGYFAYRGHYHRRSPFWTELKHIAAATGCALLFAAGLLFASPAGRNIAGAALLATILFPVLALVARRLARQLLGAAGLWQIRTVIVGHAAAVRTTLAALASEPWLGYDVVGILTPEEVGWTAANDRWRALSNVYDAGLTVLALDRGEPVAPDLVGSLVRERVPFAIAPQPDGLPVLGYEQSRFFSHDTVLVSYRNNLAQPMARAVKVVFDLSAASIGLVLAAPVFLLVALLVKLDGGPAFYGHVRLGCSARPFRCLKFRSMVVDSDARLEQHLAQDPAAAEEWAQTRKLRNDPRITRIGRFLRTTSLDELPQLLNVLRLEMSLIGPRPIVRAETHHYGEDIAYYYETRPGLTGLWQVSGRTGTTFARRVELDCWYVKNWTLWHDIAILAKTVPAVLRRRGAV